MSIGEVNSDHSGSQNPVRNVNHLGLHEDKEFKTEASNLQNETAQLFSTYIQEYCLQSMKLN